MSKLIYPTCMKDMLLKIGREQVVLMSRVYALGSGWLLNTIQDIQSFLGSPATGVRDPLINLNCTYEFE